MRIITSIAVLLLLFGSCRDDQELFGFANEPFIAFVANTDAFSIVYSNTLKMSDTVDMRNQTFPVYLPIDMNDVLMTYEVIVNDSSFGSIQMKYQLVPHYSKSPEDYTLYFDSVKISVDLSLALFWDDQMKDPIDLSEDLSEYFMIRRPIHIKFD
ncbi:MAG: hypothetical protein ACI8SE_000285 [Bacteroidia bacterium]|jgi:hypothetical protein